MVKKRIISLVLMVVLSLTLVSMAAADGYQWDVAFDPRHYGFTEIDWSTYPPFPSNGGYFSTTEVFKEDLYIVVNSLGDFLNGGQLYRSPDGEDWEAVTEPGFGYNNMGGWDMKVFRNQLYVNLFSLVYEPGVIMRSPDGENWEAVSNSWEGSSIMVPDKLGVFKGNVYVTSFKYPVFTGSFGPAELWRSPNGDPGTWELVREFGEFSWHTNGLDEYKGMLYMSVQDHGSPITIWRSSDGNNWEEVVGDGFAGILGVQENLNSGGDFVIHQDWFYFSVGPDIFRTKNGMDWELVMAGGFGNPENEQIYALASNLGKLYAVTNNFATGCEVWMSQRGDPGTWVQVSDSAFGSSEPQYNQAAYEAITFKDGLYIGTDSDAWFGKLWKLEHP